MEHSSILPLTGSGPTPLTQPGHRGQALPGLCPPSSAPERQGMCSELPPAGAVVSSLPHVAPVLGLSVLVESGQWDGHSVISGDEACSLPLPVSVSLGSDVVQALCGWRSLWEPQVLGGQVGGGGSLKASRRWFLFLRRRQHSAGQGVAGEGADPAGVPGLWMPRGSRGRGSARWERVSKPS